MSRKGQKGGSKGEKAADQDQRDDVLQAVVLADSFETRFQPFTLERPRCLLPLVNTPIIEYTLEFLANAGVEEIFVYCGAHTDQVEDYIRASKWCLASSPFSRLEIIKSTSRSVGDAMRDLDSRDAITGDFIIVSGDVVSNLPLEAALTAHRERRAADKNAIMTMILREAGPYHRTKARRTTPVFTLDPTKNRCLHYEEMSLKQSSRYVNIDPGLLPDHSEIDIRTDLIDCRIDICTPDVLALWTDSFDYEAPRTQFLFGVLKDYELNGKTIHTHIITDQYAARVRDLAAYDAISKDIVSRWSYPICPDSNLLAGQSYRFQRGNIYKEDGVILARSSVIERRSVIGHKTSIGDGSVIRDSIIGRRCQIGKDVTIEGAYIWDDTVIGNGSTIRQAVIASEALVGSRCTVEPGALLSYGVRIANDTTVAGTRRITASDKTKALVNRAASASSVNEEAVVGRGGYGYDLVESSDDEDDQADRIASSGLIYNLSHLNISDSSVSTLHSDDLSDELPRGHRQSTSGSFTTNLSEGSHDDEFHNDAVAGIFDALQRGESPDVLQIELQGLRMGVDADYHRVRRALVTAYSDHIQQSMESISIGISDMVSQTLKKYQIVFTRTMFDKDKESKPDQVDFLLLLQRDLSHRKKGESVLLFTAKELYSLDVLEEEGINQWWEDERSSAEAEMRRTRSQTQPFVEWLANAEEDSDDDSDD
ncbi:MAG: hypothetical protein M1817_006736 [Caeruleum heppii]|nr:MAG: hypothetical protein M1817_006736 [Caeruleum heppii]